MLSQCGCLYNSDVWTEWTKMYDSENTYIFTLKHVNYILPMSVM